MAAEFSKFLFQVVQLLYVSLDRRAGIKMWLR